MKYDDSTPRSAATIAGVGLSVIAPFAEGYTLSASEANVMNQVLKENLRNNFATRVQKVTEEVGGVDKIDVAALQAELDAYTSEYEFGIRKAGSGGQKILDPVEKIARKLATDKLKEQLKAKGFKVKDVPEEQFEGYVNQILEKYPAIRQEAQRQVKASQKIGADELDFSDIGTAPSAEAQPE